MESKWRRIAQFLFRIPKWLLAVFFISTWLLMCGANVMRAFEAMLLLPDDVARRVTSPDWSRTALLVRSYGFLDHDLNFKLSIIEHKDGRGSFGKGGEIWRTPDSDSNTRLNWHEEIEWSKDSSVIAVSLEGRYAFAYDFSASQGIKEPERIRSLLDSRSIVTPTITPQS